MTIYQVPYQTSFYRVPYQTSLPGILYAGRDPDLRMINQMYNSLNIQGIINLVERKRSYGTKANFEVIHFPIPDFSVPPSVEAVYHLSQRIDSLLQEKNLYIHCLGGSGRTGTVVSCLLTHEGYQAAEAIQIVRQLRPGSVETEEQEHFIQEYATYYRQLSLNQGAREESSPTPPQNESMQDEADSAHLESPPESPKIELMQNSFTEDHFQSAPISPKIELMQDSSLDNHLESAPTSSKNDSSSCCDCLPSWKSWNRRDEVQ